MKLFKNKLNYRKIFSFKNFMFLVIILYLIPKSIFTAAAVGLDPSWQISLNLAFKENLIFGKDYIFTYGPLGYLSTGLPIYTSKLLIFLFYFFVVTNGIYFIFYLFKFIERKSELIFISTALIFFGGFLFLRDAITLYFYFTFHVLHFIKHKNLFSLIIASVCCLLAFYIKVNVGLIINILFLIFIIYNFLFKTFGKIKNTSFLIGHFILLYCLSFLLKTDFFSYINNSLPLINSYNDAMLIVPKSYEIYTVNFMLITVLIIFSISFKNIIKSYFELFLFFNLLIFAFILFKNGFVRADGHTTFFFTGVVFIIMLAFLFSEIKKLRVNFYTCFILTFILSIAFCKGADVPKNIEKNINAFLNFKIKSFLFPQNEQKIISKNSVYRKLSKEVINEIGNKTVDVLGYEISFIYFNNLKYRPRPIVQSFSVYDKKLTDINYEKYNNINTAPDYVLYHYGSIDDRHGFWDESKIYLTLFRNYNIIGVIPAPINFNSLILFKKNSTGREIIEKIVTDTLIHFNTEFKIPSSDNILYLQLDYDYTLAGKIKRIFYQPSLVYMNLVYDDFHSTVCRLVLPVMSSGVPINKKATNPYEAFTFFYLKGKKNINAKSFKLFGNPMWIKDSFKVRIIEYEIPEK